MEDSEVELSPKKTVQKTLVKLRYMEFPISLSLRSGSFR